MFLGRIKQFIRTSIWRSTLVFTLIMLVVSAGLLLTIQRMQQIEQQRAVHDRIVDGVRAFTDLALQPDMTQSQFVADLGRRADSNSENVIVLKTADQAIYGNLSHWPGSVPLFPETSSFLVAVSSFSGRGDLVQVIASQVPTHFGAMVIGVFVPNTVDAQESNIILVLVALALLSLLVGYFYNRQVLARLSDINTRLRMIESGQLDIRLPISSRGDEYDNISLHINEMLSALAQQVDAVSAVTDNIAHDLRTPLGRIRLALEDIADEYPDQRILQTLEGVDQLIHTFNAMLELSRLEKGVVNLEDSCVDLSTICADAAELAEVLLGEQQTMELNISEGIKITGNAHLLFQAIYNLLENAIHYSGPESTIKLTLALLPAHTAQTLSRVVLTVSDDGPGIPPDQYEHVFERLVRLDKSRSTQGFGMGLPVVRAVVRRHHGMIVLSSTAHPKEGKSGPGLTVTIYFRDC